MALRGTLTHRKIRTLARLLRISPCFALGIVESLWHVTAEQAPAGNIGRMSDEDLAMEMFYDDDPHAMVAALIGSRLVEEHPEHRLVIHDWHIHADDAVDVRLARSGNHYANGAEPHMRRLAKGEREKIEARFAAQKDGHSVPTPCPQKATESDVVGKPVPVPVPVPEPVPEPVPLFLAPSPAEPIAGSPFLAFPTNRAGQMFTVTEEMAEEWSPLYPAVDVRQQIRNMRGWLDGNPKKRKTREGLPRFIHNWLADKQNKAGGGSNGASTNGASGGGTGGGAGRVQRTLTASREAAARRRGAGPVQPADGANVGLLSAPGVSSGNG